MRLRRLPFSVATVDCAAALQRARTTSTGDLIRQGTSGEISASTFGPPLPVDRPG